MHARLRRSLPLFFIPLLPYPPLRGTFPSRGRLWCRGCRYPHIFCLTANEKDFSLSLEMTIRGMTTRGEGLVRKYRYPHPTSAPSGHLLPEEGGSVHASPFLWKGLPSAARRGWLSFCGRAASSLPSPSGKGDRAAVDRVLPLMAYLRRSPPLFFIPLLPYPPLRGTFPSRGRLLYENTIL